MRWPTSAAGTRQIKAGAETAKPQSARCHPSGVSPAVVPAGDGSARLVTIDQMRGTTTATWQITGSTARRKDSPRTTPSTCAANSHTVHAGLPISEASSKS